MMTKQEKLATDDVRILEIKELIPPSRLHALVPRLGDRPPGRTLFRLRRAVEFHLEPASVYLARIMQIRVFTRRTCNLNNRLLTISHCTLISPTRRACILLAF